MARIRTIKPDFFTSEEVVDMPLHVRLLYIALWCEADREGRLVWRPRTFRLRYFPGDGFDIEEACQHLVDTGHVVLYGDGLAHIPTFLDHQHINPRESQSTLPAPQEVARVIDASGTRGKRDSDGQVGKEGKEGTQHASEDDAKDSASQPRSASRFADFWQAWPVGPRKQAKAECAKKWKAKGLDRLADAILSHIKEISGTQQFRDYTPAPLTYLNQRRWEDGSPCTSADPCTGSNLFKGAL